MTKNRTEKCKNELLANAVTDAKANEDVLSKALGVSLGGIITIGICKTVHENV